METRYCSVHGGIDRHGIIHFEFLNRNTLTADLYVQQLQRVHQSLIKALS